MVRRSACVYAPIGLLAFLGACAAPPPPPPAAGAAAVSATSTGGSVDGVYRGRGTANSSRCAGTSSFVNPLRVANGVASIQTNTAGEIQGPVSPDGTLMVEHGRQLLQGKFSGNTFAGTLTFGNCSYTLNYTRR